MKKSRHVLIFLLLCCLLCTLVACGGKNGGADAGADKGKLPPTDPANILVAYFSCTNNTKGVAQKIADATGGELYEILPSQPYTQEDLAYGNSSCRANNEQNSSTARPAINGSVQNMARYEVIYLGYPIWWSKAPKIIYTFLESYEFAGKTIVPFCTSGSSPIDSSLSEIQAIASDATWLGGRRFDSSASDAQIKTWVDSLIMTSEETDGEKEMKEEIFLTIGDSKIAVKLEKNSAVDALVELLKQDDITYVANEYGGFEKVGSLGHSLPRSDVQMTTKAGDVILYNGDQIVLFYGSNSWRYTKLGTMQGISAEELKALLTKTDAITVKISLN